MVRRVIRKTPSFGKAFLILQGRFSHAQRTVKDMEKIAQQLVPKAKPGKGCCPKDGQCVWNDRRRAGTDFCVLPQCMEKGR